MRCHDFKNPSPCGRDLGRGYRNGDFVISIFYNPPPNPLRKGGGILDCHDLTSSNLAMTSQTALPFKTNALARNDDTF